jgi:hypothetical protein
MNAMAKPPVLSSADRDKLVKILGMCGSAHVGEAGTAAWAAARLLRDRGLTWGDVIGAPALASMTEHDDADDPIVWRGVAVACLKFPATLTEWEQTFLRSLLRFATLSEKQEAILHRIAEKVGVPQ